MAFPPLAAIVLVFVLVSAASAATSITSDIPINRTGGNPCNGELVAITGVDEFSEQLTFGAGGSLHLVVHDNFHVTGVGDQGNTYIGNSEDSLIINGRVGGENTSPFSILMISKGSAPNFDEHLISHITVNADGTVTVFFVHLTETCHG
jgi:hypothetical protein